MRLFIAIDLDDGARAAIADEQRRLKAAFDDSRSAIKWVRPEQMHLTLVFLGEVPDHARRQLSTRSANRSRRRRSP